MCIRKSKIPYLRDVYLAYLIQGARQTKKNGYPIIEDWMVAKEPPKEMIQWDRRYDIIEPHETTICFYCNDSGFQSIFARPHKYVEKLKKYQSVVGLDASPYDNMPLVIQNSQIYINLATTYFYGINGIKIIPNVRLGDNRTYDSLDAYPKNSLISIGTNGFTHRLENRFVFAEQVQKIVDVLEPSGICVYGPVLDDIFAYVRLKDIPIYQYDSYSMKQNKKDKNLSEEKENEG